MSLWLKNKSEGIYGEVDECNKTDTFTIRIYQILQTGKVFRKIMFGSLNIPYLFYTGCFKNTCSVKVYIGIWDQKLLPTWSKGVKLLYPRNA